jgi:hypothetical protein
VDLRLRRVPVRLRCLPQSNEALLRLANLLA